MFFKEIHRLFSFTRLLKLLLGLAIGVQLIIITYNHLSGFYVIDDYQHFIIRLIRGTLLSLLAGFLIAYPDLYIIRYLNKHIPWSNNPLRRIAIQFSFTIFFAGFISVVVTLFANWLHAYTEDLGNVLISNAMIYAVVNVIMMSVLEGWIFFIESRQAKETAEQLQTELSQIKFEVLKSQINPHFMFNSLNVLSGLINKDASKAQEFIDEFAHIYRYVLETIEQPVVSLSDELDFMRSYLFLQQIRYGNDLSYSVDIPAHLLQTFLPPLSLQVVLENAIKHNIVNSEKPLNIQIFSKNDCLVVSNNIQLKTGGKSTGLGLKNIMKRYALISDLEPEFRVVNNHYVAKLPLITEDHESINY